MKIIQIIKKKKQTSYTYSTTTYAGRQTCAPRSTPSWPPRFPSSQVRLPPLLCAAEHWGTAVALAVILWVPADRVDQSRLHGGDGGDRIWSAGIWLVFAPALPSQIAQTAPSSSTAARATLKRGPASSIACILPCAIVAVALFRLAGSSPLALRPCMHGAQWGGADFQNLRLGSIKFLNDASNEPCNGSVEYSIYTRPMRAIIWSTH